jgi:RNA polymerase sigma-70 factor (ECF subfamily)
LIVRLDSSSTLSLPSLIETRNTSGMEANKVSGSDVGGLTRRLAAHDEAAFREFHTRYFDRLYQFLLVVARGQEHEAQEALQETLLRVARKTRVFDDEEAFWCWLKVVARNVARDGGRKRRRYVALVEKFSAFWKLEESRSDDAEARLHELLAESLGELAAEDRSLMEDKYLNGTAVRELSSETGLTEKAVESRLLRLRRRLRARLHEKLNEP